MADKIFLLHGMGNFEDESDWHKPVEEWLEEFFEKYAKPNRKYLRDKNKKFSDYIEIIPITYGHIFSDILESWNLDTEPPMSDLSRDKISKVVFSYMSQLDEYSESDKNFISTHLADVFLYYKLQTVREEVKSYVGKQIADHLNNTPPHLKWGIVAHSLGTSVAHDTLHALYTHTLKNGVQIKDEMSQAHLVMMLGNVSRILQTNPKVLSPESTVQPEKACVKYVTAYHYLDPFTLYRPFKPEAWPTQEIFFDEDKYKLCDVKHILEPNIHSYLHYFKHPDVVEHFFNSLVSNQLTIEGKNSYIKDFERYGKLENEALVDIKKSLEDIGVSLNDEQGELFNLANRIIDYYTFVNNIVKV